MPSTRHTLSVPTAIFLLLSAIGLSGCANAVIGVGTAAVAASTTEKGLSTSVADTQIHAKLTDQFIQNDFTLITAQNSLTRKSPHFSKNYTLNSQSHVHETVMTMRLLKVKMDLDENKIVEAF